VRLEAQSKFDSILSFTSCTREREDTRKILFVARCWWLTPVILATQEAEIWRITV
jgi:hypothetical protein